MFRVAPLFLMACAGGLTPLGQLGDTDVDTELDVPDPDTDTGVNTAPFADAGDDGLASAGTAVQLDGSASFDPDDDVLAYRWAFVDLPADSASQVINETRPDAQFYADVAGTYEIELTVDDGQATDSDTVVITVEEPNEAPIADAGPDQRVSMGATVQLNGGNSWDPEDDALTFTWTLSTRPTSSLATMVDANSAIPRFSADAAGQFQATLVVSDGQFDSAPDTVGIFVEAPSDGDCGGCSAQLGAQARQRVPGSRAAVFGLLFLPIGVLLWQRKRD